MTMETIAQAVTVSYWEFNAFCTVIMAILLYTTLIDVDRNNCRVFLLRVIVAVLCYCMVDALWMAVYNGVFLPRTQVLRYLTNILLYSSMCTCSYAIFGFLETTLEEKLFRRRVIQIISKGVFALMLAVTVTTPLTHLLLSIDAEGMLVKGPLYLPLMVLMYGHIIYIGLRALFLAFRPGNEANRMEDLVVAAYSVPVVVGAFIHYTFYTLPTFSAGFTVSTLIIYIFQMRSQISMDALTGINNRRQGERFFLPRIQELNKAPVHSTEGLYLFMMDLDKFKGINDRYGHAEGDRALTATAEVLKEACTHIRSRCILSRFGGDEFVIGAVFSEEEATYLVQTIEDLLRTKNAAMQAPYKISLSIGYARYRRDYKTLKGLLGAADAMMYERKQIAHQHLR